VAGISTGTAVVALAVGGGIGYALSNHTASTRAVTAGSQPTGTATPADGAAAGSKSGYPTAGGLGASSAMAGGLPYGLAGSLQHVFTRTAGPVTIRAYTYALSGRTQPACGFDSSTLVSELSTPRIAGTATSGLFLPAVDQAAVWSDSVRLGVAEGAPVDVVMVHTVGQVTKVVAQFTDGSGVTDQMVPVQGWSVLAATPPAASTGKAGGASSVPVATVRVYFASGHVDVETETLGQVQPALGSARPLPPTCVCAQPAVGSGGANTSLCAPCPGPVTGAPSSVPTSLPPAAGTARGMIAQPYCAGRSGSTGSGSAGSGSTGSGSTGSGSAGSGTTGSGSTGAGSTGSNTGSGSASAGAIGPVPAAQGTARPGATANSGAATPSAATTSAATTSAADTLTPAAG
jgi:hypothetical protein